MGYENFSFQSKYNVSQFVGSGAYGRVFKGTYIDGTTVALKEIIIPADDEGIPLSTLRELSVLKKVQSYNCAYLVKMFDVSLKKQDNGITIYIVFEFFEYDLSRFLSHHVPESGLPPEKIKNLSEQLLRGTEFLHSHRIIHRDLKPANIMIDKQGRQLKITDFGLSRVLGWESSLTPVVVTLWYRAPEILIQSEYLSPCDVWAAGCIIAELFNRQALFQANNDMGMLKLIFETIGFPSDCEWPALSHIRRSDFRSNFSSSKLRSKIRTNDNAALDLLEQMILFNPGKRITAAAALKLPYFQGPFNVTNGDRQENVLHPSNSQKTIAKHPTLTRPPGRLARHSINTVYPTQTCSSAVLATDASHTRPVGYRQLCVTGGWDEVDSVAKTSRINNVQPITSNNRSHSVYASQPIPSDSTVDAEIKQYDLILSVVNNAIDDNSVNANTSSSTALRDTKIQARGPVTRQQTRATRRYTQPAKTTSVMSRDLDSIPENQNTTSLSFDCSTQSNRLNKSSTSRSPLNNKLVGPNESSSSTSVTRTGRQRRTARRRTVIGPVEGTTGTHNRKLTNNSNQANTKLPPTKAPGNTINASCDSSRSYRVSTEQLLSAEPCLIISREESYRTKNQPEEKNRSSSTRYINLSNQSQFSRIHHLPPKNHTASNRVFSRYSLGPSYTYLHSIQEHGHLTDNGLRDEKIVLKSSSVTAFDNVDGFPSKLMGNSLCSPPKLPKVAQDPFQRMALPVVQVTGSRNQNLNCSELRDCEDEEVNDSESTDIDEPNNQLANTSLGINSAMTGLAIVNCSVSASIPTQTPVSSNTISNSMFNISAGSQNSSLPTQTLKTEKFQPIHGNLELDDPKLSYSTSVNLTDVSPKAD